MEQEYHNNVQFSVLQEGQCLEEPDLYAYPRVPNPTYARERYKVKVEVPTFNAVLILKCALIDYIKWRLSLRS